VDIIVLSEFESVDILKKIVNLIEKS